MKRRASLLATGLCRGRADTALMTDLDRVTVTCGSCFLGANLVSELLNYEPLGPLLRSGGLAAARSPAGVGVVSRWVVAG